MFSIIEKLMTRLPVENGKTEAMVLYRYCRISDTQGGTLQSAALEQYRQIGTKA